MGKAARHDGITSEEMYATEETANATKDMQMAWTEKRILKNWEVAIIVSLSHTNYMSVLCRE